VARWRALLSRLTAPAGPRAGNAEVAGTDPFDRAPDIESSEPGPLDRALDEIEAGALDVYAKAGLPTRTGHYRKAPDGDWSFIGVQITPEARFALALEHPAEAGWRFARLQNLGARSNRADLRAASRLLNEIEELRAARRGRLTEDHLLTAMELGGAWRALRDAKTTKPPHPAATPASPSAPTPPVRKPRAKRDKAAKPR
jgi:hypothetical protein